MAKPKTATALVTVIAKTPILADGELVKIGEQVELSQKDVEALLAQDPPGVELISAPSA